MSLEEFSQVGGAVGCLLIAMVFIGFLIVKAMGFSMDFPRFTMVKHVVNYGIFEGNFGIFEGEL